MRDSLGFTLLEIIIVFAVIAILSAIGIVSFVSYSRVQSLQTSASTLSSTLSLARSRAISQAKPTQCGTQILNGYKVLLNTASNSYELDAICSNFSYVIQTQKLPANISFDVLKTTSTSFYFPVIVNGVIGAGTIYLNGYGNTKAIVVDSTGDIR
ncbi:MAG TPA: prepilin-type N-terminal cleavage/methylation domain-containing protein [Patescibacteria group bacterium]|nr:prepilin-type N-terminal cleavage/methylation domain-containing protein [Patescibacteria group bacterium]